jgi:hypothetical protein
MNNNDTLFEDATGHAVDLFDSIMEEGLAIAYDLINTPESDWDRGFGWGVEQLMGVESIAACAGKPSMSPECHYIVEWAAENPASVDSASRERMLYVIDHVIAKSSSDSECGLLMHQRIQEIVADDSSQPPVMTQDPQTGELYLAPQFTTTYD